MAGALPQPLSPADLCHPILRRKPFSGEGWLFELKHDGFRAFVRTEPLELLTRQGNPMALAFPEIAAAVRALAIDAVLDAELVVPDARGRSDFEELRRRFVMKRPANIAAAARARPAALIVFDVLQAGAVDMRALPLVKRKAWIGANVTPGAGIQVAESVETLGEALFALAVDQDMEGVVGKKMDAPYLAGPQSTWQKVKNQEYSRRAALGFRRG